MKKRLLALCLAIVLIIGVMPVISLAATSVPKLDAVRTDSTIAVDGAKEPIWTWAGTMDKVSALWDSESLYLAVNRGTATAMTLTLGSKTWTEVSLTEGSNADGLQVAISDVAEVKINLSAAGVTVKDYEQATNLNIALDGQDPIAATVFFSSTHINVGKTAELLSSHTLTAAPSLTYKQVFTTMIAEAGKNFLMEADVEITELPVFTNNNGSFNSDVNANGVYFWLNSNASSANRSSTFVIYNSGDNKLTVKSKKDTEGLDLGVSVGEKFKLGYVWNADNSVAVYVNGQYMGRLADSYYNGGASGSNQIMFGAQSPDTDKKVAVTVSNMTFTDAVSLNEKTTSITGWSQYLNATPITGGMSLTATGKDSTASTGNMGVTFVSSLDSLIDHSKNMYMEMNLSIEQLPAMSPGTHIKGASSSSGGIFFWMADHTETVGSVNYGDTSGALIYHSKEDGKLHIKATAANTSTVDLTTNIDGTQPANFKLGYMWHADGSAEVYIDGVYLGSLGNNTVLDATGVSASQVQFRMATDGTADAEIKASFTDCVITQSATVRQVESDGYSITLQDEIVINQYANISFFDQAYVEANGKLLVWDEAVEEGNATVGTQKYSSSLVCEGIHQYKGTTKGIPAKAYGKELYVRVYIPDVDGTPIYGPLTSPSVKEYCDSQLSITADENLKKLCNAVLHYGAAAQTYFAYDNTNLVNAGIDANVTYEASMINALSDVNTELTGDSDVLTNGKSVTLDGNIKINYFFKPAETATWQVAASGSYIEYWMGNGGAAFDGAQAVDNAAKANLVKTDDGDYCGTTAGVFAKNMGNTVYARACFKDTEGQMHYSAVIAYSVETYAAKAPALEDANLTALVKAMVVYGDCASAYFAAQG